VAATLGLLPAAQVVIGADLARLQARPTRGVYVAGDTIAGDASASAVQLNPAQLGLLPSYELELAGSIWGDSVKLPGRGGGVFFGTPVFGSSAIGLGWSHVGDSTPFALGAHTVFQLAYALRLGRGAALGVTWSHVWDSAYARTDTFDFGLSFRMGRYLAFGATVQDVGEPSGLPRLWAGELVGLPNGTASFELAAGAAYAEGDRFHQVAPFALLSAILADGLRLYATGAAFPAPTGVTFGTDGDYRLAAGLMVDLDHVGATLGVRSAPSLDDPGAGAAVVLRLDGERRPPLVQATTVVRVSLDGLETERAYLEAVRRLRALEHDPGVAGVLLKLENMELGLARVEELRDEVAVLRARGKRVYAYAPFPSMRAYYLAVACDGIVVHPAGELNINGLSQTVTFYKRAMDRLGVNVDLVRIGEFKGAMEPFIMDEQSPAVRQNKNELLDDVYGRMVAAIATGRSAGGHKLDEARVRALIDRGMFTPFEAELSGLVEAVKDEGELEAYVRQAMGRPDLALRDPDPSPVYPESWPSRRVAVVLVEGAIVDGGSRQLPLDLGTFAGSDTLVAALDECRRDPSVGAVVLRVNSPGGSAFASDVIARAVEALRKARKPVVLSMSETAASGGYYIAAPADVIFSEPSTITGSIGIFGYKTDVRKLLGTLGVSAEIYRRGQHADFFSPYRPWTDEEIQLAGEKIRHFYGLFVSTVAEGRRSRGLTVARVNEIGRGHVWTGAQALGLGLVDRMGGLGAALDDAAHRGGVPLGRDGQPDVLVLPRPPSGLI